MKDALQDPDGPSFKAEQEPYPNGIHGLIVPMFTAVRYKGLGFEIDTEADEKLTGHIMDGGANVGFILGNAGMFQKLDLEQKIKHIDTVMGVVEKRGSKMPVVVGVSSGEIAESCFLAQYCEERGVAAIVYIPGYGHGDPEKKTREVLSKTKNIHLIFYHNPAIEEEKHQLDIPFLRVFAGNPRVIGIKNSTKDLATSEAMMQEFSSPFFNVFIGESANIVPAMNLLREGKIKRFAGCVPVQANLNPSLFAHFLANDGVVTDEEVETFIRETSTKTALGKLVSMGIVDPATLEVFSR